MGSKIGVTIAIRTYDGQRKGVESRGGGGAGNVGSYCAVVP